MNKESLLLQGGKGGHTVSGVLTLDEGYYVLDYNTCEVQLGSGRVPYVYSLVVSDTGTSFGAAIGVEFPPTQRLIVCGTTTVKLNGQLFYDECRYIWYCPPESKASPSFVYPYFLKSEVDECYVTKWRKLDNNIFTDEYTCVSSVRRVWPNFIVAEDVKDDTLPISFSFGDTQVTTGTRLTSYGINTLSVHTQPKAFSLESTATTVEIQILFSEVSKLDIGSNAYLGGGKRPYLLVAISLLEVAT